MFVVCVNNDKQNEQFDTRVLELAWCRSAATTAANDDDCLVITR